MKEYYLQIYHHTLRSGEEHEWIHLSELEIHPDILAQLVELGVVEISKEQVPAYQVASIHKILRLRGAMGVNIPGAVIILDLLERIESLQDELERIRKRLYY